MRIGKKSGKPEKPKEAGKAAKKEKTSKAEKRPKEEPKQGKKEFNPWDVLRYPHLAEKSMNMVELENKLVFFVNRTASKKEIKEAVERGFDVRVENVKTEITRKGQKKAYIRLSPEFVASDIASRLGMV